MKKILIVIFILLVIAAIVFGCTYSPVDIDNYEYNNNGKTEMMSSDNQQLDDFAEKNSTPVSLEEIPKNLINGIIAVEDARFYQHKGVDIRGIFRAFFSNIKSGEIEQGASTITQQLARNWFPEITTEKTISRKINEAITAMRLERKYTKDQILEIYLNEIYLGAGTYGVQEASKEYFGKDVWDLNLAECALLAGLPQAPSAYAPDENFELAKKRQEKVLQRMVETEYITEEEGESAIAESINIVDSSDDTIGNNGEYNRFVDRVVEEFTQILKDQYPQDDISTDYAMNILNTQGLTINTTINTKMQQHALSALNKSLDGHNISDVATGAFVTLDPNSGAVLAYYGGNTYIDMANRPRQPGSAIKPLIYAQAFEKDILNGNSIMLDEPISKYPKNYNNKYYGYVTVREALVHSMNVEAAKTMEMVGVQTAIEGIKEFGITTIDEKDYSIASATGGLTHGVSPLEMAQAYGVFPQGGVLTEAYFIQSIKDSEGNTIYEKLSGDKKQVIKQETADEIKDILTDVVNRGTGTAARTSYYSAGKTGTTNEKTDLWFAGFTGRLTTVIWMGDPDRKSIKNGYSSYAAQVYGNYIDKLLKEGLIPQEGLQRVSTYDDSVKISIINPLKENQIDTNNIDESQVIQITIPSDQLNYFDNLRVVQVNIDSETGKLFNEGHCPEDNKISTYYLWGQEPKEVCDKVHLFDKIKDFFNNGEEDSIEQKDSDEFETEEDSQNNELKEEEKQNKKEEEQDED